MKLFDYDSHAPQSAKRLSNSNVNAKLKIKGSVADQFKRASIKFYIGDESGTVEKSFIDSIDSSLLTHKLNPNCQPTLINEKCIGFLETFSVSLNESNWISQNNEIILNDNFNEIEVTIKKMRDVIEDVYVFIESALTRSDDVEATIWSRIIIRPEVYDIGPGIYLSYNVE